MFCERKSGIRRESRPELVPFADYTSKWFGATSTVLPTCCRLIRFQVLQEFRPEKPYWIVATSNGKNDCGTLGWIRKLI